MLGGMAGFVCFCALVAALAEPAGIAATFAVATVAALAVQLAAARLGLLEHVDAEMPAGRRARRTARSRGRSRRPPPDPLAPLALGLDGAHASGDGRRSRLTPPGRARRLRSQAGGRGPAPVRADHGQAVGRRQTEERARCAASRSARRSS